MRGSQLRSGIPFILAILVFLTLCPGVVSAYELSISAPLSVQKGMPLVVNGTSNLPAGISVDIVLSRSEYTTEEITRKTVTLQGPREFSVIFDTKDLSKGQYKVEVPSVQGYAFLGNSVTLRVVRIVDRTDEVTIKSPRTQEMDGTLDVSGIIPGNRNAGVQVQVIGPENDVVFGPEYISTGYDGSFSREIAITVPGIYEVSFTDSKGYIGTFSFTVTEKPEATAVTTTPPPLAQSRAITATALSTPDKPAFFVITGISGEVKVTTSPGVDWVIEYADRTGAIRKQNQMGQMDPEEVTISNPGDTVYLKVYPYRFSDKGEVTIFVEGAEKAGVASEVPPVFAATVPPTQKSPLVSMTVLCALVAYCVWRRYR
ncbi:MAG: hypothetical protein NQU46_04755 [Methanolinea sp.]|nr:hypothetical protein [Methanolinea sp.]